MKLLVFSVFCFATLLSLAAAQNNQSVEGDDNVVVGNQNEFVNLGDISIILQSEAALVSDPNERQIIERLSKVLSVLVENGEASFSETAVRVLARDAVQQLASQPLTRGVITTRQFSVPYQQTLNIAGTNNRITYTRNNCGANFGITFRFNREEHCWYGVGGTLEFAEGGNKFELVFEGYDENRNAKFGIYPLE